MLFEELTQEEAVELAREDGENRVTQLCDLLLDANRVDDLRKALKDKEYQRKLFDEFGL